MEESSIQTNNRVIKVKNLIVQIVSILIEISCLIVVIVQTYRSASKYAQHPLGTRIKIIEGRQGTYPDVTICPLYETDFSNILEKCNLTYEEYFSDGIWHNQNDEFENYCSDPKELYQKMTNASFEDFEMSHTYYCYNYAPENSRRRPSPNSGIKHFVKFYFLH